MKPRNIVLNDEHKLLDCLLFLVCGCEHVSPTVRPLSTESTLPQPPSPPVT